MLVCCCIDLSLEHYLNLEAVFPQTTKAKRDKDRKMNMLLGAPPGLEGSQVSQGVKEQMPSLNFSVELPSSREGSARRFNMVEDSINSTDEPTAAGGWPFASLQLASASESKPVRNDFNPNLRSTSYNPNQSFQNQSLDAGGPLFGR